MLQTDEVKVIKNKALGMLKEAHIALSGEEEKTLAAVDFQTVDFNEIGMVLFTPINTARYCGRYIVFFPGQSCAEHWHPDVDGQPGKEETFRVLWGTVYAYYEGEPTKNIKAKIPTGKDAYYTCRREVILNPGDQYTLGLHEKHWFQAGPEGAVALEFSSEAKDRFDLNTDPYIKGIDR